MRTSIFIGMSLIAKAIDKSIFDGGYILMVFIIMFFFADVFEFIKNQTKD